MNAGNAINKKACLCITRQSALSTLSEINGFNMGTAPLQVDMNTTMVASKC